MWVAIGVLTVWAVYIGNNLVNPDQLDKTVHIEPKSLHEECIQLHPDQKLNLEFTAASAVQFDIHSHPGGAVRYHLFEAEVTQQKRAFQPDAEGLYCALWENKSSAEVQLSYQWQRVAADPTADYVRVSAYFRVPENQRQINVVDAANSEVLHTLPFAEKILNFALNQQNDQLAVLTAGELQMVDVRSGATQKRIPFDAVPRFLAFSADNRFLALADEHEAQVSVLNLETLETSTIELTAVPQSVRRDEQSEQEGHFLVRTEDEIFRLQFNPLQLVERNAKIPIDFGGEVQMVDPNAWCFVHGVPHPLYAPIPPAMSETGLPGYWFQPASLTANLERP
jgi:hypothetical protein